MRYSLLLLLLFLSCTYTEVIPVYGCDDSNALNYNSLVTTNDGSCTYLCTPDQQIFFSFVQPIIENKCIGCHSIVNSGRANLETYSSVISAVNNHSLEDWVVSGQMPPQGSILSQSEITIIKNWINCE